MSKKARTLPIFVAINKNGALRMFCNMPVRDESLGIWKSSQPFVNSILQADFEKVVKQSKMTWESEPELFNIQINSEE